MIITCKNVSLISLFLLTLVVYRDLNAGIGYSFPETDIAFSGVKHDAMAGVGYSMQTSVNALSLSPANLGFVKDKMLVGYDISSMFDNDGLFILSQDANYLKKLKSDNLGALALKVSNISYYKSDENLKFEEKVTSITFGYGILLPPQKKQTHAFGISLSSNWFNYKLSQGYRNKFNFDFDLAYSLRFADIFKIGIVFVDIPIGKVINVEGDNYSISQFSTIYSMGLDTKSGDGSNDNNFDFAFETYFKRTSNYRDNLEKYVEFNWAAGTEFLLIKRISVRAGFLIHGYNGDYESYSIPFGFGYDFKERVELNFSAKRIISTFGFSETDVDLIDVSEEEVKYKKWQLGISLVVSGFGKK